MLPIRMNLMAIEIEPLLSFGTTGAAPIDPDFGEPLVGQQKRYGPLFTVQGQVVYNKNDREEVALTGDPSIGDGRCTFRKSDLDNAVPPVVIKKGDVIKSLAGEVVNYEIIEIRPSGHLKGKPNLLMAFFDVNEETNAALRR